MANVLGNLFSDIANAIRSKTGNEDTMKPAEFPMQISSIITGGGSGESTDLVKYVTFIGADGTELYKMPVLNGDDCKDPITHEDISTPTKEPTVALVYTYSGWSLTSGGSADSTALSNVTEDRTVYAAFTESARMYTVNFYDGDILLKTEQVAYGGSSNFIPTKVDNVFTEWQPEPTNITGDMDCYAQWIDDTNLANMSWANISKLSATGTAENYWSLGDERAIHINGQIGIYSYNYNCSVEIIGFNHNSIYEGNGVHFGNFRANWSPNNAIAFGSGNNLSDTTGKKYFNMNHWGSYNYGGWSGCDMRYDILGSTDVPPSGYGSATTEGRVGYNPTETCATNPVPNTFMSALPADLRAVMKPMTKYTDNVGGGTSLAENITATIDYLPLPSEFEKGLGNKYANTNEKQYQKPYERYAYALVSFNNASTSTNAAKINHWSRSPNSQSDYEFCMTSASITNYVGGAKYERFISPIFKV